MIRAGIDLGTAAIKVVLIDQSKMLWAKAHPTVPPQAKISQELLEEGLQALSISKKALAGVAATGYGKRLLPAAESIVDEISANALGVRILSGKKARTVINVGGQDLKVIKISPEGKATDFKMNDKCAAGTGRFFEMAERMLNVPVAQFGDLGLLSQAPVAINSTCAVFAESEIVSLLSRGEKQEDIIAGLHKSVARRIGDLIGALRLEDEIYLDGGPGTNQGLLLAIQEELMRSVKVLPEPQFTVAFGAAMILAGEKTERIGS